MIQTFRDGTLAPPAATLPHAAQYLGGFGSARLPMSCGAGFGLWRSGPRRSFFLLAWKYSNLRHIVHFTATTVRDRYFVDGIYNSGAFYAAQQVLPAMVEVGRGTVLLTGATASLRGSARFSALAVGKFGLRALAQSMAREFGPQGIHVAHVIIDGQINTPRMREMSPDREEHTMLSPEAIAETYWQLHAQDHTAWSLELDLRPAVESF
jgi:NAD(P)-dependent dehydrogenase (short-subunit alcohol dehydrogenase family)